MTNLTIYHHQLELCFDFLSQLPYEVKLSQGHFLDLTALNRNRTRTQAYPYKALTEMINVDVNKDVHSQLDHILTGQQQVIGRGELS
jgi:hypothetical protein